MHTVGATVLIVDDDASARRLLQVRLRALGCEPITAADGTEALEALQRNLPAAMLLDLEMPRMGGMELLQTLRRGGIDVPAIVITAHGSIETAVEAMKEGAYDFLLKPLDPHHLEIVVRKTLERRQLLEANQLLRETLAARTPDILGESVAILRAMDTAKKAAASNATILLLGESGTGKEVFANAIHRWSGRKEKSFIIVNCVALSEHLLESELFGHEKGAFTGAHQAKKGKFELAHGGSVFLDEIGDMPAALQAKLLRVLQDHRFERVGGTQPIHADIRIIAATNRDIGAAVKGGRFREDLYYRLNVVSLTLPPLRERREDIPLLARHFVAVYAAETKKPVRRITAEAMGLLMGHSWPGNVRELANAIERAVVLCGGPEIGPEDLVLTTPAAPPPVAPPSPAGRGDFFAQVETFKQNLIKAALIETGGNQTRAAELLGLQRTHLVKLLRALKIREPRDHVEAGD